MEPLRLGKEYPDTYPLHLEMFEWIKERNYEKAQAVNNRMIDMIIMQASLHYDQL